MSRGAHWTLFLAVLVMLAGGCGQGPSGPLIVLVVLDTTRADHLGLLGAGPGRTPVLDELGAEGAVFERCYSPYPLTLPSISSILTSQWPHVHQVRENYQSRLAERATTLAEILAGRGYATGAFVSSLPVRRETGCAQGFEVYDDDFSMPFPFYREQFRPLTPLWTGSERRGDETVSRAVDWLEGVRGPAFLFVHLFDPHSPYDAPEPYASSHDSDYAAEIAFTDALVGRLLAAVRARGETTPVIAVVGDHGEGLGEHEEWAHGMFVYESTVHVPWILTGPAVAPSRVSDPVRLVDVAPTLLEVAGLPAEPLFAGESTVPLLDPAAARGEERPVLMENHFPAIEYGWAPQEAIILGGMKRVRTRRSELYDLTQDPRELLDLSTERPGLADSLDAHLDAILARTRAEAAAKGITDLVDRIEPEARVEEWLRNLGYIGSDDARPEGPRPDAKDRITDWNRINDAETHATRGEALLLAGDPTLALVAFEAALGHKRTPEALLGMGVTLNRLGRYDHARPYLAEGVGLRPNDVRGLLGYAVALDAAGRLAAADSVLYRVTLLDSTRVEAWHHRASVAERRGRLDDAVAFAEAARRGAPGDVELQELLARLYEAADRLEEAAGAWSAVVSARDWDPVPLYRWGGVLARSGDVAGAREVLGRARQAAGRGALRDSVDALLQTLP
jgi:arylsulfatase A-like enzyme/Flp pilus assembly protein TadD